MENNNLRYVSIGDVPYKNIYGRVGKYTNPLPLLFNGSGVEVNVNGSELWIDVETDSDFHEMWVAYEINGSIMSRFMLLPGEHSICLFRNMSCDAEKTVKFYRELQAMSEDETVKLVVKGFKLDGEFKEVKEHKYKIEFIGDSITSGEGTYGAFEDTDWLAMYMGFSRNYANMTAKALDADYHIISQGGWGVYCGWDNDVRHNIPSVYEKVCGLSAGKASKELGMDEAYDFSSWQPDAIVVNLGTNDDTAFFQPPFTVEETGVTYFQRLNEDGSFLEEDLMNVEKAVIDFLKMLRKHNPGAHIVWCYGMLGYRLTLGITEAINVYVSSSGDKNIGFINLPNTTMEGFGSHMHPGEISHRAASLVLTEYLKNILEGK